MVVVLCPGLDQQHSAVPVGAQPICDQRARRAGTDDDVVEGGFAHRVAGQSINSPLTLDSMSCVALTVPASRSIARRHGLGSALLKISTTNNTAKKATSW